MAVAIDISFQEYRKREEQKQERRKELVEALIQWELRYNGGKSKPKNLLAEMKTSFGVDFGWDELNGVVREATIVACKILMGKPAKPRPVKGQKPEKTPKPKHRRQLKGPVRFPACYVRL